MRIASVGQAIFAVALIALGIAGLVHGAWAGVWQPMPQTMPLREVLTYLCAIISIASGIGLLWQRTAAFSARLLLAWLLLWFLVFRLPAIVQAPTSQDPWSGCGESAVMVAAAWVLYAWLANDRGVHGLIPVTGESGLRIARAIYGLAMIPFGIAHFTYLKGTDALVPAWLPWHLFWACFTGCAFLAAGVAMLLGLCARLAASLSALQLALFTLLVWVPIIASGAQGDFQWSETVISLALTAGAWVVADSYRGMPWLTVDRG